MKIKNFLFHRVNPVRDSLWDPMDVALFDKTIKYITDKYSVRTIEDVVVNGYGQKGKKPIATISFDDGYKDNIEYAAPILTKYSCPASFYVVTSSIDNNYPTWTYVLEYLFQHTNKLTINLEHAALPRGMWVSKWANKAERVSYVKKLKPFLKKLTHVQREEILSVIEGSFNDVEIPQLMMNWDDIRQLQAAGFVIGSHSHTHPMLGTIADRTIVENELEVSAGKIQKAVGEFPLTISYPIGSYTQETIELSKKAGYKLGLAVHQKFYDTNKDDIFAIPRTELYNESWLKTLSRINGSLELVKSLTKMLR
ncbi:polysaccharide deacetylase family protein [Hymenobacter guriensis]|uniref:Polysaccharide deacetylase family protein n=1 Tax=Hymenobacter guriensis TaxID=2793065 RepID=A0ABS0L035_9BACT|nr:polysaccharide deacetylase family protein [Hymenobacter guriensis]MBG8553477.1 polysaccharide deacetylase family protein [Hymenobacter guriensis]